KESLMTEVSNLRDASSVTTASQLKHIETLKAELEATQNQARTLSSQAKSEAIANAERLARAIQAEEAKVQQAVSTEISGVRQSATDAHAKIASVSTDVGSVRSEVTATKTDLEKTIADLKSVKGDL